MPSVILVSIRKRQRTHCLTIDPSDVESWKDKCTKHSLSFTAVSNLFDPIRFFTCPTLHIYLVVLRCRADRNVSHHREIIPTTLLAQRRGGSARAMVTVETHHLESSTAVGGRASALEEILEAAIQVLASVMGRFHPLIAKPIPQNHGQCVSRIPLLFAMIIAWWSSWLSYDRLATG